MAEIEIKNKKPTTNKEKEKTFKIYNGNRPRVLFLGNGIRRAFSGTSWDDLLDIVKDGDYSKTKANMFTLPMSLNAALLTKNKLSKKYLRN